MQRLRSAVVRSGVVWEQSKWLVGLLGVVCVLLLVKRTIAPSLNREELQPLIQAWGLLGPLLFLGISAASVVLFVPPLVSIGLGSLAFGALVGVCYSVLGITAGACLAFLIGRHLIGDRAAKLKRGRLQKLDDIATSHGLLVVIGLRLVFFGQPPLNYAAGATTVRLLDYVLGTLIGLLPRAVVLSFAFELLQTPGGFLDALRHPSSWFLVLLPMIRLAGIWLLAVLTRRRLTALR